jgi:hypothetical protein
VFACFTPFVGGCGGKSRGRPGSSSHSGGGILRCNGGGVVVGEEFVDEGVWWVSESGPPAYECKLSCISSRPDGRKKH